MGDYSSDESLTSYVEFSVAKQRQERGSATFYKISFFRCLEIYSLYFWWKFFIIFLAKQNWVYGLFCRLITRKDQADETYVWLRRV